MSRPVRGGRNGRLGSPATRIARFRLVVQMASAPLVSDRLRVCRFPAGCLSPIASLILHEGLLTHLSAARTSRQCVRQRSCDADTQGCN